MATRPNSNSAHSLPTREGGGRVCLSLSQASLAFGTRTLFSGLDLQVRPGEFVGLSGESGCGKTSLLRALLGFVPLTFSDATVCGLPLDVHHIGDIRRRTAYLPQELQPLAEQGLDLLRLTHGLEANRTPFSLNSPLSSSSPRTHEAAVPAASPAGCQPLPSLLKSLGLDASLLSLSAAKLSGGQRQRLLLAAALALPKPLLLLDEPTSALDEESTQRVGLALLRACHEEHRAALAVSHDPALLAFCDRVITLAP